MNNLKSGQFYRSSKPIRKMQEFIDLVEEAKSKVFSDTKIWYRGLASREYKLIPSLYREKNKAEKEKLMTDMFKDKAKGILIQNTLDEFEWYFLMQHYGLKTRLLDWTEGYLIALFFALKVGPEDNRFIDPCVWMMSPFKLNELTVSKNEIVRTDKHELNLNYEMAQQYLNLEFGTPKQNPIAISSTYSNERILRQRGCFTIHGDVDIDILSIYRRNKCNELVRIVIDRNKVEDIILELRSAGISESSIFPDLEGLSREINMIH